MYLFLKTVHAGLKIGHHLYRHRVAGIRCLLAQFGQGNFPHFRKFFFTSLNIELQLLEITQIFCVELIEQRHILHHFQLGLLQIGLNALYLCGQLLIPLLDILAFFHQAAHQRNLL